MVAGPVVAFVILLALLVAALVVLGYLFIAYLPDLRLVPWR